MTKQVDTVKGAIYKKYNVEPQIAVCKHCGCFKSKKTNFSLLKNMVFWFFLPIVNYFFLIEIVPVKENNSYNFPLILNDSL
jgi:hypothetical protein